LQKIRESEKEQILSDYQGRLGELVTGQVLRMDGRMVVGRYPAVVKGYMPPEEQMRGEILPNEHENCRDYQRHSRHCQGRRIIVSARIRTW